MPAGEFLKSLKFFNASGPGKTSTINIILYGYSIKTFKKKQKFSSQCSDTRS